jgi:cell wall-associated NlpC family hydrolase
VTAHSTQSCPTATDRRDRWTALGSRRAALLGLALAVPLVTAAPAIAAPHPAQQQEQQPSQAEQQEDRRTLGERALEEAARHDGKPYKYGATGPDRFDCSGYMQFVFGQVGRELPRTSRDQYAASEKVAKGDQRLGDLIAIHNKKGTVTHVGIYAGDNRMWVASSGSKRVKLQDIYTDRYRVGRFS